MHKCNKTNTPLLVGYKTKPKYTQISHPLQSRDYKGVQNWPMAVVAVKPCLLDDGEEIRVRKLTPRECFRLQGFPDSYFEKAAEVCSDSQLYKQAGNSVTVNVIYDIARRFVIE